jgi:hypothetical protein
MTVTEEQIRYSAHVWVNQIGKVTLTIRRSIPAGIDGPFGGLDEVTSMGQVELYLEENGYALNGNWKLSTRYDGLNLDADLVRTR